MYLVHIYQVFLYFLEFEKARPSPFFRGGLRPTRQKQSTCAALESSIDRPSARPPVLLLPAAAAAAAS
jgi:hypothetical protein